MINNAIVQLWKENLNSDDQQFYQFQQNKQSYLILTRGTQKRTMTYGYVYTVKPVLRGHLQDK
jgi:hypothetical protein